MRATECKSLVAHKNFVGFNPIVVYSSVPGRAVCLSVSVPVWFRGRGGGWCSSLRPCTPRMSWGTPHGRAVAPKMIKLRRSSIVACYRNLSSIVACNRNLSSSWASLSGALGSVPAGWVRLRPALGFRFRRFGVEKKSRHRNQERTQSAYNDADDDGGWTAARG